MECLFGPDVFFCAVSVVEEFVEGLGALKFVVLDHPLPPHLTYISPSTSGKSSTR